MRELWEYFHMMDRISWICCVLSTSCMLACILIQNIRKFFLPEHRCVILAVCSSMCYKNRPYALLALNTCIFRGSLLTRSLADIVKKEDFVLDSEYLITMLVVVPK